MSTDRTRFASSRARDNKHIRRAQLAPLLAAGMSLRAISAATSIPMGAVHRAKRQLEKSMAQQAGQKTPAASYELPISYVVKKNIGGVPQQIRRCPSSNGLGQSELFRDGGSGSFGFEIRRLSTDVAIVAV
jgi:hypothetical protein